MKRPVTIKIKQVNNNVAIVIPEIGFAELPNKPTILDETVTKKKLKTITNNPVTREVVIEPLNKLKYKKITIVKAKTAKILIIDFVEISCSVLSSEI